MGRDRSTVTNTLQAMERAGLIYRERSDTDARALVVALSDKGRDLIPRVRETWAQIEAATVGGLSREQLRALVEALSRMKEGLSAVLGGELPAER